MSIINEALKKTEEQLQKNSTNNTSLRSKHSKIKLFLVSILILSAGILLGNFIFILLKNKTKTAQTPKENTLPLIQTKAALVPPILPSPSLIEKKTPAASFVLNGIFFSDNDGYALVNNQIVRENDFVDGAKVSLITANSVELVNADETLTLTTNR